MDTLVLRCQHTWTVVLPRWGVCRSRDVREALRSSSDSWSALDSSGDSGKCGKNSYLNSHCTRKQQKVFFVPYCMYHDKIFFPRNFKVPCKYQGCMNMVISQSTIVLLCDLITVCFVWWKYYATRNVSDSNTMVPKLLIPRYHVGKKKHVFFVTLCVPCFFWENHGTNKLVIANFHYTFCKLIYSFYLKQ